MAAFFSTLCAVLFVELTDRTRLIAMLLSTRYRAPIQLISGMTFGYVPAIALAVWGSGFIAQFIPFGALKWIMAVTFIGFGIFLLRTENEHEEGTPKWAYRLEKAGPFFMGFILVAVTEFGDKSQIATAGLMMKYRTAIPVFLGSISAQTILNIIYVALGYFLGQKLPVRTVRWIAGILFIGIGILALVK